MPLQQLEINCKEQYKDLYQNSEFPETQTSWEWLEALSDIDEHELVGVAWEEGGIFLAAIPAFFKKTSVGSVMVSLLVSVHHDKKYKWLIKPTLLPNNQQHWTDIVVQYLRALDIDDSQVLPYFPFQLEELPQLNVPHPIITIHPGGDNSYWKRRWPLEHYLELCIKLCQELKASIYLIGGKEDSINIEQIQKVVLTLCPMSNIYNLAGATFNQTGNYIQVSDLFIGNDSGSRHLAAAIGIPIIAIFGPSDPEYWGSEKIDKKHTVLSAKLPCQPCNNIENDFYGCHLQEHNRYQCLKDVTISMVLTIVKEKLSKY